MNINEVIEELAERTGLSIQAATAAFENLIDILAGSLRELIPGLDAAVSLRTSKKSAKSEQEKPAKKAAAKKAPAKKAAAKKAPAKKAPAKKAAAKKTVVKKAPAQ